MLLRYLILPFLLSFSPAVHGFVDQDLTAEFVELIVLVETDRACQSIAGVLSQGLQNAILTITQSQKNVNVVVGNPYALQVVDGGLTDNPNEDKILPAYLNDWWSGDNYHKKGRRLLEGVQSRGDTPNIEEIIDFVGENLNNCIDVVTGLYFIQDQFLAFIAQASLAFSELNLAAVLNPKLPFAFDLAQPEYIFDEEGHLNNIVFVGLLQGELNECNVVRVLLQSGILNAKMQILNSKKQALTYSGALLGESMPYVTGTGFVTENAFEEPANPWDRRLLSKLKSGPIDSEVKKSIAGKLIKTTEEGMVDEETILAVQANIEKIDNFLVAVKNKPVDAAKKDVPRNLRPSGTEDEIAIFTEVVVEQLDECQLITGLTYLGGMAINTGIQAGLLWIVADSNNPLDTDEINGIFAMPESTAHLM